MKTAAIAGLALVLFASGTVFGANRWAKSRPFVVTQTQSLQGQMTDAMHAVVPHLRMQLVRGKKVVSKIQTDDDGKYDFGSVEPGTYQLRILIDSSFCPPRTECANGVCAINSTLRVCGAIE